MSLSREVYTTRGMKILSLVPKNSRFSDVEEDNSDDDVDDEMLEERVNTFFTVNEDLDIPEDTLDDPTGGMGLFPELYEECFEKDSPMIESAASTSKTDIDGNSRPELFPEIAAVAPVDDPSLEPSDEPRDSGSRDNSPQPSTSKIKKKKPTTPKKPKLVPVTRQTKKKAARNPKKKKSSNFRWKRCSFRLGVDLPSEERNHPNENRRPLDFFTDFFAEQLFELIHEQYVQHTK